MKLRTLVLLAATCLLVAAASSALADTGTWESTFEPPGYDAPAIFGDSFPPEAPYPCEIFYMTLTEQTTGGGTAFGFSIKTNFGPSSTRASDPGASDSYQEFDGGMMQPGDLFIRVRNKSDNSEVGVYGLGFIRAGSDPAYINNVYGGHEAFTASQQAGVLYGNVLFGTGTMEPYVDLLAHGDLIGYPVVPVYDPNMAWAQALAEESSAIAPEPTPNSAMVLTQIADALGWTSMNYYPSVLLEGTPTGNSGASVAWVPTSGTDWAGEWQGGFTLLDGQFDPNSMFVEVWWSQLCGNDAVVVYDTYVDDPSDLYFKFPTVPLPGSLLLCGIGAGFMGLVRGLSRRRARRS